MSASATEGSAGPSTTPLALPAPGSFDGTKKLTVDQTIKLDELGPMVVNSDGTLSRIANWKDMTKEEKDRTVRVLGTRNKLRIANEERKLQGNSSTLPGTSETKSNDSAATSA